MTIHKWWSWFLIRNLQVSKWVLHQGLRGARWIFHVLDQLCFIVILIWIPFKPYCEMASMIFVTSHTSGRIGPQRLTPSCGGCRFNAEGISLRLPTKSKMCQYNFSLASLDQRKYLKTSPRSEGQRESPTLMCSGVPFFPLNGFGIFVHVLVNLSCGHSKSECRSETLKQQ